MLNFTIIKTELRNNLKLIIIWAILFGSLAFVTFSLFDTIKAQQANIVQIVQNYPPELLKAFNIDSKSYSTIEGLFSGNFLNLFLLANSVLAIYLATSSIGKEISGHTIAFLLSKPLTRLEVFISKTIADMILLLIVNTLLSAICYAGAKLLTKETNVSLKFFVVIFFSALLMELLFMGLGQVLSIIVNDAQALLVGTGIVFLSWILDIISGLQGMPTFVKYLTPFYYVDVTYIRDNHTLNLPHVAVLIVLTGILIVIAAWTFKRKDLDV